MPDSAISEPRVVTGLRPIEVEDAARLHQLINEKLEFGEPISFQSGAPFPVMVQPFRDRKKYGQKHDDIGQIGWDSETYDAVVSMGVAA